MQTVVVFLQMTNINSEPDLREFREEIRAFIKENLPEETRRKTAAGIELTPAEYREWMGILPRQGWIAVNWPTTVGGPGWSLWERSAYEAEYYRANAPRTVDVGVRMVGPVLLAFGSEDQKARYLPKILDSTEFWCQGYSEPGAGSDLSSLRTKATLEGDHYRVQGGKIWTSYAHMADRMFALVRTSDEGKKRDGISILLIDMKSPGVRVRPIRRIDGRHEFNEVFLDDVMVPVENRVGDEGQGWKIANYLLGHERGNMSLVVIIEELFDMLKNIAQSELDGQAAVAETDSFKKALAEIEIEYITLRESANNIMRAVTADTAIGHASSVVKLGRNRSTQDISRLMMEAGGYTSLAFDPLAIRGERQLNGPDYLFRLACEYFDSRRHSIAGGSQEIQKDLVARRMLGL
jgi:alkylation response protein AidB-like acyl-CoA dehydrogenase